MKTAVISKTAITDTNLRIDASYHLSDAKTTLRYIMKSPYSLITIGDTAHRIWHAGRWRRVYVNNPKYGITLVGSSAMLCTDLDREKMVSRKYTEDIKDKTLKKGWILISCSGTIGNCAFTNAQHAEKLASQDVIRINPNNILRAGVIYAYLSSKFGYTMLTQGTFGNVIQHIEPENVRVIPIPQFPDSFQEKVDTLIQDSARLREEATEALEKAVEYLSSVYKSSVTTWKSTYKTAVLKSNDIWSSLQHRLDPPALINEGVLDMVKLQSQFDSIQLGKADVQVYRPGIFKRCYVMNGYPYIKGSDIFKINPFVRCAYLSKKNTPFVDEMLLHEGQILITCAGSVGEIKLITKEYDDKEALGSQDIIRLESKDELLTKEFLFVYLKLPIVQSYIQSMKYGSVIERIEPFHIESIPVLLPTKEQSLYVTEIIKKYEDNFYQAFCKEEEAISLIETEIESWTHNK